MSENKHELKLETPQSNAEELGTDAELYEEQSPQQFSYDPSKVGTLTAAQMDRIYEEAWSDKSSGRNPLEVQHGIYAKLEQLGIDPSVAQDGGLVVRFEGIDGKSDIRPIVIDAGDFGTRIRNAEMTAVETPEEESREEEKATEDKEQQEYANRLLEDLRDTVRPLEQGFQENDTEYARKHHVVAELIEGLRVVSRKLMYGEPVGRHALMQLAEGVAPEALRVLNNEASTSLDERTRVVRFEEGFGDAVTESKRKLDETRQQSVKESLDAAHQVQQDLLRNRTLKANAAESMLNDTGLVVRLLGELQYDSRGFETYGHQLQQVVGRLEAAKAQRDVQSRQSDELLAQLKKALTPKG